MTCLTDLGEDPEEIIAGRPDAEEVLGPGPR